MLALARGIGAQDDCSVDKQVAVAVAYRVNATGHPQLNLQLQQPIDRESWLLDIDLQHSRCGFNEAEATVLDITVSGPPILTKKPVPPMKKPVPPGYTLFPGLGHYRRPEQAMAWEAARDLCTSEGATLAMPSTVEEMKALREKFPFNVTGTINRDWAWIGASDIVEEGKWISLTGVPLDETTSIIHHVSNLSSGLDQNCLLYSLRTETLYNLPCNRLLAFYCKLML